MFGESLSAVLADAAAAGLGRASHESTRASEPPSPACTVRIPRVDA